MSEIIASRGFVNDNEEQLSFFIEEGVIDISLIIEHCPSVGKDKIINLKISPDVLRELRIMCDAALEQLEGVTNVAPEAFKNYL